MIKINNLYKRWLECEFTLDMAKEEYKAIKNSLVVFYESCIIDRYKFDVELAKLDGALDKFEIKLEKMSKK